jgi:uncharacterized membrane protein
MQIPSHIQEHIETIARHEQEFNSKRSRTERIGDSIARFAGSFSFVLLHIAVFFAWMVVNLVPGTSHFDPLPFPLLDTIVALEAILLASFILMRQSGLAKRADERDHLMLQILLLTEREVSAVVNMNQQIAERVGLSAISRDVEIQEMAKPTSIDNVAQTIQENLVSE